MKNIQTYIYESSNDIHSEKEFCELAQLRHQYNNTEGTIFCGDRTLHEKRLQFYNKKWIYGYSVYYDGKTPNQINWPIIGIHTEEEYDEEEMIHKVKGVKAFIMNSKEDVKTFGEHCMAEDNSIFTVEIIKNKINCKADDYDTTKKEAYSAVNKDKSIIWVSVGNTNHNDFYTTLQYKK